MIPRLASLAALATMAVVLAGCAAPPEPQPSPGADEPLPPGATGPTGTEDAGMPTCPAGMTAWDVGAGTGIDVGAGSPTGPSARPPGAAPSTDVGVGNTSSTDNQGPIGAGQGPQWACVPDECLTGSTVVAQPGGEGQGNVTGGAAGPAPVQGQACPPGTPANPRERDAGMAQGNATSGAGSP
jgi:hypothetical protein